MKTILLAAILCLTACGPSPTDSDLDPRITITPLYVKPEVKP